MYSFSQLTKLTREGFLDLWPALRQAFNSDTTDDRLDLVYGARPRGKIIAIAAGGTLAGEMFARVGPAFPLKDFVNWSAVVVGLIFAVLIRRYLFASKQAAAADFTWLAGSLIPPIALCAAIGLVSNALGWSNDAAAFFLESQVELGSALVSFTNSLGVAAALTVAVATLCYSRDWIQALFDLALRLLIFRIMVWVTALIMFEVRIVGEIVLPMVSGLVGLNIPVWVSDLADQMTYAGLLTLAYLAIIGSTWTVCKSSFGKLLNDGQVDILKAIEALVKGSKDKKPKNKKPKDKTKGKDPKT